MQSDSLRITERLGKNTLIHDTKIMKPTLDQIIDHIQWLQDNRKAPNIHEISRVINSISILAVTVGQDKTDAYELMNNAEVDYDILYAQKFSELTKSGTSAAAAKPIVEAELGEQKRAYTQAKNIYKKLDEFLSRLDRVCESHRQFISLQKLEIKNI
jgi:hypothetical protein